MECDFRISKVPAADWDEGSMRPVYAYQSAYPRFIGYTRGDTYLPSNTDTEIYPWKPDQGRYEPIGHIPQVCEYAWMCECGVRCVVY